MKIQKLYKYYAFGYNYHVMRSQNASTITNKDWLENLEEYLRFIDELGLQVTKKGVELNNLRDDFDKLKEMVGKATEKDKIVDSSLAASVLGKLTKIDGILDAELNTRNGYLLEPKRYPNETLTESIDKLFASNVYSKMPVIAQYDFTEAGLCLVFDRYTAVAFHILRGTEAVLKEYYCKLLAKSSLPTDTWRDFLNRINYKIKTKALKPFPAEELMINLENLRKYYRNNTQHPVKIYSVDDAQDLLGVCIKTINEIIQDLTSRKLI